MLDAARRTGKKVPHPVIVYLLLIGLMVGPKAAG
jgi:hypothetical protein